MGSAMEMSVVFQVSVILGIFAFILLVACIVPVMVVARRRLTQVEGLLIDGREVIKNINQITKRASEQMEASATVSQVIKKMTELTDKVIDEIELGVDQRLVRLVMNSSKLQKGAKAFFQVLLKKNLNNNTEKVENLHV